MPNEPRGAVNHVAVPLQTLQHAIQHSAQHHPINVKQGSKGRMRLALIKEIQRNAFSGDPIHVDFMVIQKNGDGETDTTAAGIFH